MVFVLTAQVADASTAPLVHDVSIVPSTPISRPSPRNAPDLEKPPKMPLALRRLIDFNNQGLKE